MEINLLIITISFLWVISGIIGFIYLMFNRDRLEEKAKDYKLTFSTHERDVYRSMIGNIPENIFIFILCVAAGPIIWITIDILNNHM